MCFLLLEKIDKKNKNNRILEEEEWIPLQQKVVFYNCSIRLILFSFWEKYEKLINFDVIYIFLLINWF